MRSELAAVFWFGNTTNDTPCFFIRHEYEHRDTCHHAPSQRGLYRPDRSLAESEAISRIAELSRQAGDAVRGSRPSPRGSAEPSSEPRRFPIGPIGRFPAEDGPYGLNRPSRSISPGPGALFDNTSGVEHHHLVGVRHRAHAMRDRDDSLTGEQPRERLLHLRLILHVKRRGRLVEPIR